MWLRILLLVIAFIVTSVAPPSITTARGEKLKPKTMEQDFTAGPVKPKTMEDRDTGIVGGKRLREAQMPSPGAPPPPDNPPPPSKGPTKGPKN